MREHLCRDILIYARLNNDVESETEGDMFLRVDVDEQQFNFNGILRPGDTHSKKHIQLYIVAFKYASTKKATQL